MFIAGAVLVAVLLRMAVADSTAVFKARALACGLVSDDYDKFKSAGLDTMALFAFSCNYAPGASDEKPLTDLIAKLLGGVPTVKQLAPPLRQPTREGLHDLRLKPVPLSLHPRPA